METDSWTDSRMTAGEERRWRDEQKGKRTHGHGQQCGDGWGEECIRHQSTTFLALGTSAMEDTFSMGQGWGRCFRDSNAYHSSSPLAVQPGS